MLVSPAAAVNASAAAGFGGVPLAGDELLDPAEQWPGRGGNDVCRACLRRDGDVSVHGDPSRWLTKIM